MLFRETTIEGLREIVLQRHQDERGSFARTYCAEEFASAGLPAAFVQASTSVSRRRGTLRGMHHQDAVHNEGKLVRCVRGAVHDVVADLRPGSPSFMVWQAFHLAASSDLSLYIPPGCAHGFQTLEEDCEVTYQMTAAFVPGHGRGFRYDDPATAIAWPLEVTVISAADLAWPPLPPKPVVA